MARACPDCGHPMAAETYHNVALDSCGACAGLWFDQGELRRVMQSDPLGLLELEEEHLPAVEAQPGVEAKSAPRRCPDCDRTLDRFQYMYNSPVQLDACEGCGGIWVEDGELRKIQAWLDRPAGAMGQQEAKRAAMEAAVARACAEHEQTMGRLRAVTALFTLVGRRHPYGWNLGW